MGEGRPGTRKPKAGPRGTPRPGPVSGDTCPLPTVQADTQVCGPSPGWRGPQTAGGQHGDACHASASPTGRCLEHLSLSESLLIGTSSVSVFPEEKNKQAELRRQSRGLSEFRSPWRPRDAPGPALGAEAPRGPPATPHGLRPAHRLGGICFLRALPSEPPARGAGERREQTVYSPAYTERREDECGCGRPRHRPTRGFAREGAGSPRC